MSFLTVNHNTNMMDYIDSKGKVINSVCHRIEVKALIRFIDKPEIETRAVLQVFYPHQTSEFTVVFSKTIKSQESVLEELTRREFFVGYKFANALRDYLIRSAQKAQLNQQYQYYHETLGYYKEDGKKPVFLLGDTILPEGFKSLYNDDNIKFRSGSAHDYDIFMNEHVLPYKNMRFALVLGLTSVIASYLKDFGDAGTILINLSGASSTGKTTSAQFIASLWGQPKVSNLGLVRTFNSTLNALMHSLRGVSGVPVTLDDATTSGFKNRTELIYQLAQSEPKLRMSTNTEYRDSGLNWSGVIFITSETPVISDSESRMGIVSRIIDTDGLIFTESSEHAEIIKRTITNNYGHIGKVYVRGINHKTEEELSALFLTCKEEVISKLVIKDNLTSRIASKLAAIYMTAILTKEILQYQAIDPAEILEYLISKDQSEVEQRHIGEKALEVMKVFITEHHRHFEKLDEHSVLHFPASGTQFGHFRYFSDKVVVTIPTSRVESTLRSNFIYDTRVIYDYWHQHGVIQKQQDRYSISDTRLKVRTIKFNFKPDEEMMIPWLISPLKGSALVKPDEVPVSNIHIEDQDEINAIFAEGEESED
jgi:hypothetical protein